VSHVVIHYVHVTDVARGVAATVSRKVSHFSTIEAWSFWMLTLVTLLSCHLGCIAILVLHDGGVGVGVISWTGGHDGVVIRPLLLLLLLGSLLVLLGSAPPRSWSELVLVLSKHVVESSWIEDSSSSPDELDHLFPFCDVDRLHLVSVVILGKWVSDDLL
jgi:hypothetical protein